MSHGGMKPEAAALLQRSLAQDSDTNAQIDRAEEIAANYDGDERQDIKTDVMNAFYQGVTWGREHLPDVPENPLVLVNQTMAGFKGAFYVKHRREPTMQEVFDAGVRAGIERMDLQIKAALA